MFQWTYHSQVPDLLHDTRPEGLEGLLGIAAPGSERICRHPLLGCTEEWQGGGKQKVKYLKTKTKTWYVKIHRHSKQVIRQGHKTPGHRIHCQSKPGLGCPERFPCVRTTYSITAYNYNTVKSKIRPWQASILVLVGCWHGQEPTTRHAARCLIMNGSITFCTKLQLLCKHKHVTCKSISAGDLTHWGQCWSHRSRGHIFEFVL